MPPRPYHHRDKAGNAGDLLKHGVLAALVAALARPGQPFRYGESHCGPPGHTLAPGGAWQAGVGAFRRLPPVAAALSVPTAPRHPSGAPATAPEATPLRPYLHHGLAELDAGRYPGSSRLVWRLVRAANARGEMVLWEHNPAVVAQLRAAYAPQQGVRIHEGDGAAGLLAWRGSAAPDLLLLDPVVLEPERLAPLLTELLRRGWPLLCWTPRRGRTAPAPGTGESPSGEAFHHWAVERFTVMTARWRPWGDTTCGCRLLLSPQLAPHALPAARSILALMGWKGEISGPG